jgi:site-specific recombinase XerD
MKTLSKQQVVNLVGVIGERSPFGLRDRCMMKIFFLTGLRVYELSMLNVGHLVRRSGEVREQLDLQAVICKYSRARVLPISGELREVILELLAFNKRRGFSIEQEAPLFQNRYHCRLNVRAIQRLVKHYREEVDMDIAVTPHSFRHGFSCEVLRNTGNSHTLKILLGHRDLKTTDAIYSHAYPEDLKKAMATVSLA